MSNREKCSADLERQLRMIKSETLPMREQNILLLLEQERL